jgi:hypothetical protein
MELKMYLGSTIIDSVPLDRDRISKPGYLGTFKRELKQKHSELLLQTKEMIEFLVELQLPVTKQMVETVP